TPKFFPARSTAKVVSLSFMHRRTAARGRRVHAHAAHGINGQLWLRYVKFIFHKPSVLTITFQYILCRCFSRIEERGRVSAPSSTGVYAPGVAVAKPYEVIAYQMNCGRRFIPKDRWQPARPPVSR